MQNCWAHWLTLWGSGILSDIIYIMTKALKFTSILLIASFILIFTSHVYADPPDALDYKETYVRGKILQIISSGIQTLSGSKTFNENLKVQLLEGREKGKIVNISYSSDASFGINQRIGEGAIVVVGSKPIPSGEMYYSIYEPYRLNNLWWILSGFMVLVIAVVGKRGIGAIVGLIISLATILYYIVPQILIGKDPLIVCITGAIVILFVTTYIAHGISIKTTVGLIGTAFSLILAGAFSLVVAKLTYILGLGDQNSYALQLAATNHINPQGILLGGIIIGTLGALNDVTITQAFTIFAFAKESPKQHFSHLFNKSMNIGREHIISTINTLVLAYAGSSFAIFLFFASNPANLPWWLLLNDQFTMEEIIRAIVGSTALILSVPITTLLASYVSLNKKRFGL